MSSGNDIYYLGSNQALSRSAKILDFCRFEGGKINSKAVLHIFV